VSSILDFSRYQPPGVYVDPQATPTLAVVGIDPTVVCLIGNGIGYNTYSETISFGTSSTVTLSKKGIKPASIVVKGQVTDPGASDLSVPAVFTQDQPGTPADYSIATNAADGVDESVTTITRNASGRIETDLPQVSVSYQYTDSGYHALHAFDDYDSFTELYGEAFDDQGNIQSPLSLAGMIAMQNGSNYIYAVALSGIGTIQQQYNDAYRLLAGNYEINVVVPLFSGLSDPTAVAGMCQSAKAFVETAEQDGYTRIALLGFDKAFAPTAPELAELARSISSKRVVISWPNQVNIYNGVTNVASTIDGFYLAAALAGLMSAQLPQIPLTRKYPKSFTGMPPAVLGQLTRSVKNQLSSAGVCVTEVDRSNRMVVRHGLTSYFAGGILNREISLVRAQDSLYNLMLDTLTSAGLIGTVITAQTPLQVKGIVVGALETAKTSTLIFDYNNLKVRQQVAPGGDPTVIEVKFAYKPSFPLNYILVSFSIDTSTGTLSTDANDSGVTGSTLNGITGTASTS
jgi:hypothetical protein